MGWLTPHRSLFIGIVLYALLVAWIVLSFFVIPGLRSRRGREEDDGSRQRHND